jgi:hypothetical protein
MGRGDGAEQRRRAEGVARERHRAPPAVEEALISLTASLESLRGQILSRGQD